jgi:UDP-GlcNAc:undecaprenyl-phosphate/decaprenyl-phosphate GlcNAc-1-phosphate transferase
MFQLTELLASYLIIIYSVILFSKKFKFYDIPNNRKLHKNRILNTSGLALYIFFVYLCFKIELPSNFTIIIYVGSIVFFTGLLDDKRNLSPSIKLILISLPTIYLITNGYKVTDLGTYEYVGKISLGQFYFIFTLFSVGLLTNSYNYIDGVDGLLISTLIINIIYLSLLINDEIIKNFFFFICMALSINLIFNFLPKQNQYKIFTGNGGSLFLGFFISFLIIYFYKIYNIHPSYLIWTCWYPIYDFLYVTFKRIIKRQTFYVADNKHLHHIVFRICKKSHIRTTLFISFTNILIIIFGYQISKNFGSLFSLILFPILFLVFCFFHFFLEKKYKKN